MIIPLEQMVIDHERDVDIVRVLCAEFPRAEKGRWMWLAATFGYSASESDMIVKRSWLHVKYPEPK